MENINKTIFTPEETALINDKIKESMSNAETGSEFVDKTMFAIRAATSQEDFFKQCNILEDAGSIYFGAIRYEKALRDFLNDGRAESINHENDTAKIIQNQNPPKYDVLLIKNDEEHNSETTGIQVNSLELALEKFEDFVYAPGVYFEMLNYLRETDAIKDTKFKEIELSDKDLSSSIEDDCVTFNDSCVIKATAMANKRLNEYGEYTYYISKNENIKIKKEDGLYIITHNGPKLANGGINKNIENIEIKKENGLYIIAHKSPELANEGVYVFASLNNALTEFGEEVGKSIQRVWRNTEEDLEMDGESGYIGLDRKEVKILNIGHGQYEVSEFQIDEHAKEIWRNIEKFDSKKKAMEYYEDKVKGYLEEMFGQEGSQKGGNNSQNNPEQRPEKEIDDKTNIPYDYDEPEL